MNAPNLTPLGERVATLESRVASIERRVDKHSDVEAEVKEISEYIAQSKGEAIERDKQHNANQWRLNIIIGALGLLIAYETLIKDHHRDNPQKSAPQPAAHSELPSGFDPAFTTR